MINFIFENPSSAVFDLTSQLIKYNQVTNDEKAYKRWFDTDQPEEEEMPDGYNQSLDVFRKLLMIRAWCPDRIIPQARKYIANSLGKILCYVAICNLYVFLNLINVILVINDSRTFDSLFKNYVSIFI